MKILSFTVGPLQENAHLVICEATRDAIFIDPGDEAHRLIDAARQEQVKLLAVYNTHAHIDHVGAVDAVKKAFGVPFFLHRAELFWLDQMEAQAAHFGLPTPPRPDVDRFLEDGQRFRVGEIAFEVLHVPGHAPGHVVFVARGEKAAFVGDILFAGSIGRTDIPAGDHAQLVDGICAKLFPLGDEFRCYPGHGPPTTIGEERRTNPWVGTPS